MGISDFVKDNVLYTRSIRKYTVLSVKSQLKSEEDKDIRNIKPYRWLLTCTDAPGCFFGKVQTSLVVCEISP